MEKLQDIEDLEDFLSAQSTYSSDFKALVLKIYFQYSEDISQTILLTGVSQSSLYTWVREWNEHKKKV